MNLWLKSPKVFRKTETPSAGFCVCTTLGLTLFLLTWSIKTQKLHFPFPTLLSVYMEGLCIAWHMWALENSLWALVLLPPCAPRSQTQGTRLGIRHLYPQSHLPSHSSAWIHYTVLVPWASLSALPPLSRYVCLWTIVTMRKMLT